MTRIVLLGTLLVASLAWADEPERTQVAARLEETKVRLALTEEQAAQLKPILEDHFDTQMTILDKHGLDIETRGSNKRPDRQQWQALRRELDENKAKTAARLAGLLSAEQLTEFENIQAERKKQLRARFRAKWIGEIGSRLALTEEQREPVHPILEEHFDAQMAILDTYDIGGGSRGDNKKRPRFRKLRALRKDMSENEAETAARLTGLLSAEQLAEFENLQAERKKQLRARFRAK